MKGDLVHISYLCYYYQYYYCFIISSISNSRSSNIDITDRQ